MRAFLDTPHLTAVIRLALGAHGFVVSKADVDAAIRARYEIGRWLRDEALQQQLPTFVDAADYQSIAEVDPLLWDNLPRMAGFGYQQAVVFQGVAAPSAEVDIDVATVGAAFSAGIALIDYLVDTQPDGALVFEALNSHVVGAMFDQSPDAEAPLAEAYRRASDARIRLVCALVGSCAAGFHRLYLRSGNSRAWTNLAETVGRMYEAERAVSVHKPRSRAELRNMLEPIEAKSVLPFVAMRHIVALSMPPAETDTLSQTASAALGRVVSLTDDLVDLPDDCHRGAPNSVFLRLADRLAEQGRSWPSDADVYHLVDEIGAEIVDSLQPHTFGVPDSQMNPGPDIEAPGQKRPDSGTAELLNFARLTVASWVGWQEEEAPSSQPPVDEGSKPSKATIVATQMLLEQQSEGYREAVHRLLLPRIKPDGVSLETHSALLFQRAIVLDGLLDARVTGHSVPLSVLAAEALTILCAKHPDAPGGWNYIPEVTELPPDGDDLGMVLQVLCRIGGPALASACDEAIRLALAQMGPDGGIPTWILDFDGRTALGETMRAYVDLTESGGVHPDVVANLLYGLILYDPERYHRELLRAVSYLESSQDEQGAWLSRWYSGPYYGAYRAVSVLSAVAPGSAALERAYCFLERSQCPDGSWGEGRADPLATALAILALVAIGRPDAQFAIARGVAYLLETQEADGAWPAGAFIAFPTSDGAGIHTYASRTITTTFCLKALLASSASVTSGQGCARMLSEGDWPTRRVSSPPSASEWG